MEQPFGDVLLQILLGDFLQLNPVQNHTLLEALLPKTMRVPGTPRQTTDEDRDGYNVFRKICENVILFTGTHRFKDEALPQLLEIMRAPGGKPVPQELRRKIKRQIVETEDDPRLGREFVQEGQKGFFAFGARAAIQWEQVARLQQLHIVNSARVCAGARACVNLSTGKPDYTRVHSMAVRSEGPPADVRQSPKPGQLVYYFQAVDRFKHRQSREVHMEALKFVNMSKSAGLMGMLGVYVGMRVRLTKKVLPPELVQEATGEVVGIVFHPLEKFGGGHGSNNLRPGDDHPCWKTGHVKCDLLPLHVEVRFDGCTEDYTGTGRPGVWYVEPTTDEWKLPHKKVYTVDHPRASGLKRVKAASRKDKFLEASRSQLPLAPEFIVTFQNIQGQTVRGPDKQPKGLVLDLFRPQNMGFATGEDGLADDGRAEFYQHVYMGMGRAESLDRILLRNFPKDEAGQPDWKFFEQGPPEFLVHFMRELEKRAELTYPRLLQAQLDLGAPAWEDVPRCEVDPHHEGRFIYVPEHWGRQGHKSEGSAMKRSRVESVADAKKRSSQADPAVSMKRRWRTKTREAEVFDCRATKKPKLSEPAQDIPDDADLMACASEKVGARAAMDQSAWDGAAPRTDTDHGDAAAGEEAPRAAPEVNVSELLDYNFGEAAPVLTGMTALRNAGNTCYINALLNALAACSDIYSWCTQHRCKHDFVKCPLCQLARDLEALREPRCQIRRPLIAGHRKAWSKGRFANTDHEDAQEAWMFLSDRCDEVDVAAAREKSAELKGKLRGDNPVRYTTPLWSICGGKSTITVQCTACGFLTQPRTEMWNLLTLSLSGSAAKATSLDELCDQHWRTELLADDEDRCEAQGCGGRACRLKHTKVVTWPRTLIVNLKRFEVTSKAPFLTEKIPRHINFRTTWPVRRDLPPYHLKAVVVHEGEQLSSGHYYTYAEPKRHSG